MLRIIRKTKGLMFVLLLNILLTGCGEKMYNSGKSNFSFVSAVEGISFEIVSDIARNATAITNISPEMSFEPNQTYLYKDGESCYFIFNINSLVFVCEKGTKFGFHALEDKTTAIENDSILGVWLHSPTKKLQYRETNQNGVYKMIATVNAEVALTRELYNDFTGQMAYLYDSETETEWTMFVGSAGHNYKELDKETQDGLEYMAATFIPYTRPIAEELPEPEITLGGESEPVSVSDNSVTKEESLSNNSISQNSISDNSISENSMADSTETEVANIEETETKEDVVIEEIVEEIIVEESIEEIPKEDTADISKKETLENTEDATDDKNKTIVESKLNNQKTKVFEDNKIYHSNIYNMVPIGKRSYADIKIKNNYEKAIIKVEEILTGKEAESLIKKYCDTTLDYDYFEVMEGCSWHVARYTLDFSQCSNIGYMNIKLKGMDGDLLKYRGIRYTPRTYDIKVNDTLYYSYYAIPNGCYEYALECGDGTVDTENVYSAYYNVKIEGNK